jgi:hypothetical protein
VACSLGLACLLVKYVNILLSKSNYRSSILDYLDNNYNTISNLVAVLDLTLDTIEFKIFY